MKAHVAFILDRSGSMAAIADATIKGTIEFVEELFKKGGDVEFSLVAFDGISTETWIDDKPIAKVNIKRAMRSFAPRGSTPLLDAMGETVTSLKPKVKKGEKAIVVCMTDGYENASRTWDYKAVNELVTKLTKKGNWTFVYLGANQDAWLVSSAMGMSAQNTMAYSSTPGSTKMAMRLSGGTVAAAAASPDMMTSTLYSDAGVEQDQRDKKDKSPA